MDGERKNTLKILHKFQQDGYLCDIALVSFDGKTFLGHAGVLAAASSLIREELEDCDRGNYTIFTSFSHKSLRAFIDYAYTGDTSNPVLLELDDLGLLCNKYVAYSHAETIISVLYEFSTIGLLCNMAYHSRHGNIQPAHSYVLAAKYMSLSEHFTQQSIVNVELGPSIHHFIYNRHGDPLVTDIYSVNSATGYEYCDFQVVNRPIESSSKTTFLSWTEENRTHDRQKSDITDNEFQNESYLPMHDTYHHDHAHGENVYVHTHNHGNSLQSRKKIQIDAQQPGYINVKPYQCDICHRRFTLKSSLKEHQTGHVSKPYECHTCGLLLRSRSHYLMHNFTHINSCSCDICGQECKSIPDLEAHKSIHTDDNIIHTSNISHGCGPSSEKISHKPNLEEHPIPQKIDDKPHHCDVCNQRFKTKASLKSHNMIHSDERPHTCTTCGKSFRFKIDITRHIRMHTDERPFPCHICNKGFRTKASLNRHENTHVDSTPYVCDICGKNLTCKYDLKMHKLIHTNDNPFICSVCNKRFTSNGLLCRHLMIHTDERPHVCDVCDKSFAQKSNLKSHMLIHTDEKPFTCDTCHTSFRCHSHLSRHKLLHTNEKRYECENCHKRFTQKSHLKSHEKVHMKGKLHS